MSRMLDVFGQQYVDKAHLNGVTIKRPVIYGTIARKLPQPTTVKGTQMTYQWIVFSWSGK